MTSDPQSQAESLDDDKIGGDYPPDEPLGAEDYGTTAAEERHDEPLEGRVWREEPDELVADGDPDGDDPTLHDAATEHEGPGEPEEDAMHVEQP